MSAALAPLDYDNPATEPVQFFDSESVEGLIADYQRTGQSEALGEIITRCQTTALVPDYGGSSPILLNASFQKRDQQRLAELGLRPLNLVKQLYGVTNALCNRKLA